MQKSYSSFQTNTVWSRAASFYHHFLKRYVSLLMLESDLC